MFFRAWEFFGVLPLTILIYVVRCYAALPCFYVGCLMVLWFGSFMGGLMELYDQ